MNASETYRPLVSRSHLLVLRSRPLTTSPATWQAIMTLVLFVSAPTWAEVDVAAARTARRPLPSDTVPGTAPPAAAAVGDASRTPARAAAEPASTTPRPRVRARRIGKSPSGRPRPDRLVGYLSRRAGRRRDPGQAAVRDGCTRCGTTGVGRSGGTL